MILFKRVSESFQQVEDREWMLLALETLGVLAGILIAFELNEWASRRNEAARHDKLMERLFDESRFDVILLRDIRDGLRSQVKTEGEFAKRLSAGECPPDPLWSATYTVNRYPAFKAPRSVYQELMGAGGLSSIKHERVRFAIAQFSSDLEWVANQNENFRMGRRQPIPDDDPRVKLTYDPTADEPVTRAFDREQLCQDQGFRSRIIHAVRNHWVMLDYHDVVTNDAIYLCGVLGESLGRRCQPEKGGQLVGDDAKTLRQAMADQRKSSD